MKRFVRGLGAAAWLVGLFVALGGGCNDDHSLVGGECAVGYSECGGVCVLAGTCAGVDASVVADGSLSDGTLADGSLSDGTVADASSTDGSLGDVGGDGSGSCVPPFNTVDKCGDCLTRCQPPNDTCQLGDAGTFVCAPLCTPPLVNCGGVCVDTRNDPDNCGQCGHVCPSSICVDSRCEGATTGAIVYIGHDYVATPASTAQAQVLSRAVILPTRNPVRVLVYTRYADANAVGRVNTIFASVGSQFGRTVNVTSTTVDDDVSTRLSAFDFDVLVVHDQVSAPAGTPAALGASWAATLPPYTHDGGVVIVLDGAAGTNREMPQFITATGLLTVTSHTSTAVGSLLDVVAPADAIGVGVVSPHGARRNTTSFESEANGGRVVWVVTERASGRPNVLHKTAL